VFAFDEPCTVCTVLRFIVIIVIVDGEYYFTSHLEVAINSLVCNV